MKLKVTINPDHVFYPDIENNLELPENQRFGVVIKKINQSLHSHKWLYKEPEDDKMSVEWDKWVKAHVLRLLNPPVLQFEDGHERQLTRDDIFSDEAMGDVLVELVNQISSEVFRIRNANKEELDVKN